MIKLKDILSELDTDLNVGDVIFGSNKKIADLQNSPTEKNTEIEDEIIDILKNWVEDSNYDLSVKLWKKYPLLKRLSSVFPKILKPETPNGTNLYRGLGILNKDLKQTILNSNPNDWEKIGDFGGSWKESYKYTIPIKYKPHSPVQSWTDSYRVAAYFSSPYPLDGVILMTKQDDNFLFSPKLFSIIRNGDEREILHFGEFFTENVYIIINDTFFKKIKS